MGTEFLIAQRVAVRRNVILQDNKSSILLENNGKASAGKQMRHINIRYFFITDREKKGECVNYTGSVEKIWWPIC